MSELSLFDLPSTQTSATEFYDEEIRPVSQVTLDGPFVFRINGQNSMDYLDLKSSQLYVKLKVDKKDGSALCRKSRTLEFIFAKFNLDGRRIQNKARITCNYNPYRAYIQTVLKYGQETLSNQ